MFEKIKSVYQSAKKQVLTLAVAGMAVVGSVTSALAVPTLDFTAVGTAITDELSPAIAAAMPIAGVILAAGIGWKLYKRFTK
jgi:predicted ATP-grasp superfamily ATP-dependent carboligase